MKKTVVVTGSKGRLATEIIEQGKDRFEFIGVDLENVDITNRSELFKYFDSLLYGQNNCSFDWKISIILHCAAWTAVDKAETNKDKCFNINVNGTKNVVEMCRRHGLPIIYVCTDYVFNGEKGGYKEEDTPDPVNYYSLTKLLGELIVRQYSYKHIVVRTSFKPEKWQYPSAFDDIFTSAEYIPIIAKEFLLLLGYYDELCVSYAWFRQQENIFHIGSPVKRSVYELAKIKNPNVLPMKSASMGYKMPKDVSLDTSKWQEFKNYVNKLHKNKVNKE